MTADYLAQHPELAGIVPNICGQVREAFGPEAELSLERYIDPEVEDRFLVLYVRQNTYEPDFLDQLQAVSERFNAKLEEIRGDLVVATDFARPRGKLTMD